MYVTQQTLSRISSKSNQLFFSFLTFVKMKFLRFHKSSAHFWKFISFFHWENNTRRLKSSNCSTKTSIYHKWDFNIATYSITRIVQNVFCHFVILSGCDTYTHYPIRAYIILVQESTSVQIKVPKCLACRKTAEGNELFLQSRSNLTDAL